jgi:hypothetical protein
MWRAVTSTCAALTLISSVAAAQQPCTTDATRVVAEIYRHTLERNADRGAQAAVAQLANGQLNVKELVRRVAQSQEYMQRFGQTEPGEGQPYERAVARLYRHILGRQPDADGLRTWTRSAQQRGLPAVANGLIDSAEYDNNFGEFGVPGSGGLRYCADTPSPQSSLGGARRLRGLGTSGRAIAVGGDRRWVDTGINLQANDRVSINANGQIRLTRDGAPMTADGVSSGRTDGATMPTANVGALVARFGDSAPLFIGQSRTFRTGLGGRLYLGVNDNFFDDNTGEFIVTVDVN